MELFQRQLFSSFPLVLPSTDSVQSYVKRGFKYGSSVASHVAKPLVNGLHILLSPSIYMMRPVVALAQLLVELAMDAFHLTVLLPCRILGKFEVFLSFSIIFLHLQYIDV